MPDKIEKIEPKTTGEVTASRLPEAAVGSNPGDGDKAKPAMAPLGKFTPGTFNPPSMPGGMPVKDGPVVTIVAPPAGSLKDAFLKGFHIGHDMGMAGKPAALPVEDEAQSNAEAAAVDPKAKPPKHMRTMMKDGLAYHVHEDAVDSHRLAGWEEVLPDGSVVE
jgi:hypothetical protein